MTRLRDVAVIAVVILAASVVVTAAVTLWTWATSPILPPSSGPITTGTARPIPPGHPAQLTAVPLTGWGPGTH